MRPAVMAVLEAAYQAHTPELISDNVALGTLADLAGVDLDATEIKLTGLDGLPSPIRRGRSVVR